MIEEDDPNDPKLEDSKWLVSKSRVIETGEIITTVWKREIFNRIKKTP